LIIGAFVGMLAVMTTCVLGLLSNPKTSELIFPPSPTPTIVTLVIPTFVTRAPPTPATESPVLTFTPTPSVTPTASAVPMVFVPDGEFTMGNDHGDSEDKPAHPVYLSSFYIDTYEVTNSSYRSCVMEGVCQPPTYLGSETRLSYFDDPQYNNYPVIWVNWDMARTFCEWRGMRLPTDAEWEKAARGKDARSYPWGEGYDCGHANFSPNDQACVGDTAEVGRYPLNVSPYGAFDMAGNVWEWVQDWFMDGYYLESPLDNPAGPDSGTERVIRGGAWVSKYYHLTTYNRDRKVPSLTAKSIGMRCACRADSCPSIP
jgi:eukaryotic-like serine/threonine-protein kinase